MTENETIWSRLCDMESILTAAMNNSFPQLACYLLLYQIKLFKDIYKDHYRHDYAVGSTAGVFMDSFSYLEELYEQAISDYEKNNK